MIAAAAASSVWLVLALASGAPARAAGGPAPSDAVLISIDDLRADRVRPDLMPNLSALRREGVSFEAAYSQATWTLPSHASLFFSQYPWSHGAGGFNANHPRAPAPGSLSLAQALSLRGYATASFANCPFFNPEFGLSEGFSSLRVRDATQDPLPEAFDWLLSTGASPRFVFAHTYAVHNYQDIEDRAASLATAPSCPLRVRAAGHGNAEPKLDCAQTSDAYDRAARCLDQELGALFARLKAAGRWDRTLIAVVADHGEGLCDGPRRDREGHNDLGYEQQLKVPWILKRPSPPSALAVREPVELIDVAPTILGALGLPPEPAFAGRDRLAAGAPRADAARAAVFAETDRGLAVREGRWKLLRGALGQVELYDVESDPDELVNLAAARPRRVSALDVLLRAHAGSQRAGWRFAARGRAGARTTLEVSSDRPLTMVIPVFVEPEDPVVKVSSDGLSVEARFVAQRDGDEDWLIVEVSTPGARLMLRAFENGAPLEPGRARLGLDRPLGPQPWLLSDLGAAAETAAVPAPRDGLTVWRGAGSRAPRPVSPNERTRRALQAAGYLP